MQIRNQNSQSSNHPEPERKKAFDANIIRVVVVVVVVGLVVVVVGGVVVLSSKN